MLLHLLSTTTTLLFPRRNPLHNLNLPSVVPSVSKLSSSVVTKLSLVQSLTSLMPWLAISLMESLVLLLGPLLVLLVSFFLMLSRTTVLSVVLVSLLIFLFRVVSSATSPSTRSTVIRSRPAVMLLSLLLLGAFETMTPSIQIGTHLFRMTMLILLELLVVLDFVLFVMETVRAVKVTYQIALRIHRCSCMSSHPSSTPRVPVQVLCTNISW